jgi:hypothetical protein
MARPLDFIVFGVPRSGTKTLVRALNLHPHVYCSMERFHFRADHSKITFPDTFLDASDIHDRHDLGKIKRIREDIAAKGKIRHAGNKLPRYYFALDRINAEVPALKNIWIYRSPYGFIQSWNRRELNSRKGRWRAGQVGLFGLLELFTCIDSCLKLQKDVFVFPYDHGLNRSPEPIADALAFLGAAPGLHDLKTFEADYLSQRREAPHRLALASYEEEILDTLRVRELDAIMAQTHGVMLSEVAGALRTYLDSVANVLPRAVDRAFSACDNAAVPSFGREYVRRNRAELGGLFKLAEGSKALADFRRFGVYRQLKALYVQRWALKRRLASIRLSNLAR